MKESLCITTFVSGDDYQEYIPIFIFSILKSYPSYEVVVFTDKELRSNVTQSLEMLKHLGAFQVRENYFDYQVSNFSNVSISKMKRWLLYEDDFQKFENLYIGDIDMLIVPENPSLMKQHLIHCDTIGLDYSNIIRRSDKRRLSGLHFVKVKPYFEKMLPIIKKYRDLIIQDKFTLEYDSNEFFLYKMILESGLGLCPQASDKNLNDPLKPVFRPHHGVHLAIFRNYSIKKQVTNLLFQKQVIQANHINNPVNKAKMMIEDPLFEMIVKNIKSRNIKTIMKKFKKYQMDVYKLY